MKNNRISIIYDKSYKIEQLNEDTEEWIEYFSGRARVNKNKGNEFLDAGAIQYNQELNFDIRYNPLLKEIQLNTQSFRIIFANYIYDIIDYDDYMFKHKNIRLVGRGNKWLNHQK